MPKLNSSLLTLVQSGNDVTATFRYDIEYTPIETFLLTNGLILRSVTSLLANDSSVLMQYGSSQGLWGYSWWPVPDPPAVVNGAFLDKFPDRVLKTPTTLIMTEEQIFSVTRAKLDEDPAWRYSHLYPIRIEKDEIKARLMLIWDGLPFPPLSFDSEPVDLP